MLGMLQLRSFKHVMASGLVGCALSEVVHEKLLLSTPRINLFPRLRRDILHKITSEDNVARFDSFSIDLTAAYVAISTVLKGDRSFST